MTPKKKEPIAIIGLGCRFPGDANSAEEFWSEVLAKGKDAVCEVPADRWDKDAYYNSDYTVPGKISIKWGGFIKDIDKFDPQFFGIAPREALRIDPQQRLLLEVSYQAMEDAGLDVNSLAGKNVGVFVGISAHDYGDISMHPTEHATINGHTISGGSSSIASNRISYVYDFRGPSFSVDTACSSSLVAIHSACSAIWNNECPIALVGGANALIKPEITMSFSKGGFLSPDGRSKAFDSRANGYIRSEGVGVIVLKPLSKAVEDGDKIYATIVGTALNQDGATDGLNMPSQESQIEVLREAYERAGIDPAKVQYVEAHGTGTAVGDPIEATSIGTIIGSKKKKGEKLYIGSVKTNVGHLEPASGMAGIIKLLMSIKYKKIPQNLHFKTPNPKIKFDEYNLAVPTKMIDWPAKEGEDIVTGINSFGFGGANAHIVIKGYNKSAKAKSEPKKTDKAEKNKEVNPELFILSAKTAPALKEFAGRYKEYLSSTKNSLTDICHTGKVRRTHHEHRFACVAGTKKGLVEQIEAYLNGENRPGMSTGRATVNSETKAKLAFVYSGQGPQWYAMGRELLETQPVFRDVVEKIDKILAKMGWLKKEKSSLLKELSKDEKSSRMNETEIAQPAIFAIQVGLTEMWKSVGIVPDAIVGHSIGEVAAAYASGALNLEEATRIIYWRSRSQSVAAGKGKMLAVGLTEAEARTVVEPYKHLVAVAVINGPKMLTLSGDTKSLEAIAAELEAKDIFNRFLRVDVPFHSHYLDVIKTDFMKSVGKVKTNKSDITLYTAVTGKKIDGKKLDAKFWYSNIRESVLFYHSIKEMIKDGYTTFIELAPHPILSGSIEDTLSEAGKKGLCVPSLRRKEPEMVQMLGSLGTLFTSGYPVDWKKISRGGDTVDLPFYPFTKDRYWLESTESYKSRMGMRIHPHLKQHTPSAGSSNDHIFEVLLDKRLYPYIEDHRVQGPIIFPGAGSCELAISCGLHAYGKNFRFIEDIYFKKAVFLPDEGEPPMIQFNLSADDGSFGIYSRKTETEPWTRHIHGKLKHLGEEFELTKIPLEYAKKRCLKPVDMDPLYDELYSAGLMLGPTFRSVQKCWRYDEPGEFIGESLGELVVPEAISDGIEQFHFHPAILDACFQTLFGSVPLVENEKLGVCIPVHIEKIRYYKQPTKKLYTYGRLQERSDMYICGELRVYDDEGNLCLDIQGFRCRFIEGTRGEDEKNISNFLLEYQWKIAERHSDEIVRKPIEYLPSPMSISDDMKHVIKEIQDRPERDIYDKVFDPYLNDLTAGYIEKAMSDLGFNFEIGSEFTSDEFIKKYKVAEGYLQKLFRRTLEILGEKGTLSKSGKGWKVVKKPEARDLDGFMADLFEKYPAYKYEMLMLGKCGPKLADIFTGKVDPVEVLFPDSEWENTIKFYQESYSFKKYNEIVQNAMKRLLANFPEDRTLRIIEVGAGTGGMTQAVLPVLPADRTSYTYTDLSYMFMVKAEERFSNYPFLNFKVLDIFKDLEEQGIVPNSYDIVVASDVIHATQNVTETLKNIQKLLAPNGMLAMLEVTQCPWWVDLVFGLTEGWWMFEDYDIRPGHPTMSRDKWVSLLGQLGFTEVNGITEALSAAVSAQTVFLARNKDFKVEAAQPALPASMDKGGSWLIFGDKSGKGKEISDRLEKLGERCYLAYEGKSFSDKGAGSFEINPLSQDDMNSLFAKIGGHKSLRGIIHSWNLDNAPTGNTTMQSLEDDFARGDSSVLNMLRTINSDAQDFKAHIWLVTGGATHIGDMKNMNLSQAGIWGLTRSAMHEFQNLDMTLIDLSAIPSKDEVDSLFAEICMENQAEEVALRGRSRYLHKFVHTKPDEEEQKAMRRVKAGEHPFHLITKESGVLDNLRLQDHARTMPGKGEIEIKVSASGLNFKDVMIAMGALHEDAPKGGYTGKNFGMECSGVVAAVGEGVTDLKPGDEVLAIAPDTFASFAVTKTVFAAKKPANMSFEDAASIPFAYITAYYSLMYAGRLEKGERVLIHAAAGGVGLAAVKIAIQLGCEVFATAGSADKREFLKSLGVKHVLDSRSLKFAEDIKAITGGEGVDVVLNSLSGSMIYKSLSVLRKYGRFVEIGKSDIYENSRMSLRPFWNNLSYLAVDIDKLLTEKPELCGRMVREFMSFFNGSAPEPHPYKTFSIANIVDSFRYMAQAKHIGKVVVKVAGEEVMVSPSNDVATMLKPDATYVIVGGFSGLGLSFGKWFADYGVKNLVVMSRRGASTDEAKAGLEYMKSKGMKVIDAKLDITNSEDVARAFAGIKKDMPPIRGVVNSAMVLDDCIIDDMTHDRFMKAVRPKVMGVWNLHVNTLDQPIDFFVSFSSVAAQYGTPAQCNYAAANVYLDMMSYYRQANGLKASTISWGVISEVGFVASNEKVNNILASQGWRSFNEKQIREAFARMILQGHAHRSAIDADWPQIAQYFPKDKLSHRFGHILNAHSDSKSGSSESLRHSILSAEHSRRQELLQGHVAEAIARILGTSASKLDLETPVSNMGLDSLMANQLRNWIQSKLEIDFSMMKIMRGPSIIELTKLLLDEIGEFTPDEVQEVHDGKSELEKWVVRRKPNPNAKLRLFCLPYMAGGASAFYSWSDSLPDDIEVCAIQYPGREERMDEEPIDDVNLLIKKLSEVVAPLLDKPFALYGHSIGAGIAFKFAQYLKEHQNKLPSMFFVGGWIAPHLRSPFKLIEKIKESEIKDDSGRPVIYEHMRNLEIPEEVISNKKLMDELMPSIKADILIGKKYRFDVSKEKPLECPLIAFAGDKDTVFSIDQVKAWEKHTTKEFELNVINGGHIFIRDDREGLLVLLLSALQRVL